MKRDLDDEELGELFSSDSEEPEDAETIVRWFRASYESECATCWEIILPDDRAGYIDGDDQASCQGCCEQALAA